MKKLYWVILFLVLLQSYPTAQTGIEGKYDLKSEGSAGYHDEYVFSDGSRFKFTRLKYLGNECGAGEYAIKDSALTLIFHEVPANVRDSLRSYYIVNKSKLLSGDTAEYIISVFDHRNLPLQGSTAQLVDENGFTIVEKVKKSWDIDPMGEVTVNFPKNVKLFGIKIASKGYETITIPVKKDTNKTITVMMLESEKCFHVIEGQTVKKFYLKNIRYSGFHMREENAEKYEYFKKEKQ
jgi:hypothetical protein